MTDHGHDPNAPLQVTLIQLLRAMIDRGASDLHLTKDTPPQFRIDGSLVPLKMPPLRPEDTKQLIYSALGEEQKIKFEKNWELDFSFGVRGLSRFRGNVFMQRGAVGAAFRAIPHRILSFEELGLPQVVADLAALPRGLAKERAVGARLTDIRHWPCKRLIPTICSG